MRIHISLSQARSGVNNLLSCMEDDYLRGLVLPFGAAISCIDLWPRKNHADRVFWSYRP